MAGWATVQDLSLAKLDRGLAHQRSIAGSSACNPRRAAPARNTGASCSGGSGTTWPGKYLHLPQAEYSDLPITP